MANEQYASALLVDVDGTALPADVAALLTYAYVDDSRNVPDLFLLRFRDPHRTVLAKGGFTIGAKVRLRVQTSDPGGPTELMTGEVTAVELELESGGTVTEVRGLDHAHRLFRGRRVAAYPNMTIPDVVRTVTERAGLEPGRLETAPGTGTGQHEQLSQDNISDWEFLGRLADLVGAQVLVKDGTLDFVRPAPPDSAPDTGSKASQDPLVLEADRNLVALRAGLTAAEQVPEVSVRGWDPVRKKAVVATATPRLPDADARGADPPGLGRTFASPPYLVADPGCHADAPASAATRSVADQLGGACVEIEGVARGNPQLRAGAAVALSNVGAPFEGRYTLSSTRHLFSEQAGYTTSFTVSGRQERSLYGLVARTGATPSTVGGLVPAVVSDAKDPAKQGRVRLTFPWLDEKFTSGWARVAQPGAGPGRGAVLPPEVGDEVLVGFAGGDLDTPYVVGGLWNGVDAPPTLQVPPVDASSGEVQVRAVVSRTGHRLELAESAQGADGVLLSTGDSKFLLRLDERGRVVALESAGTILVTGKEGITIDAGSGALELSGRTVSVTATGDATIDATGKLALSGKQGATMDGATVAVTGQGSAELTASGTLTVRGSLVRIN